MITTYMKSTAARPAVSSLSVRRALVALVARKPGNLDVTTKRHQWSGTISFAQAESDFTASDRHRLYTSLERSPQWSQSLSYAQAESDFSASDQFSSYHQSTVDANTAWSCSLSFAAPESDFVSAPMTALGVTHVGEVLPVTKERRQHISNESARVSSTSEFVPAPETALGAVHMQEFKSQPHREASVMLDFANSIMTSPESATGSMSFLEMLDDDLKASLQQYQTAKESLPMTVAQAMRDERPIVITTAKAPFHVYDVNAAWEGLCGFCRDEAKNKSVGELLQGPATDDQLAMDMVRLLKKSGFAEGTLTNYKKNGQPFSNHLLLGKIVDDDTANTDVFFIGVLQDVTTNKASTAM